MIDDHLRFIPGGAAAAAASAARVIEVKEWSLS